jgi:threonine dehydratase
MEKYKKLIEEAAQRINKVVSETPLQFSRSLSERYNAEVYLKREDLQQVRSFKIRGALNKMLSLSKAEQKKGVVCASAGNHAQGVALSCSLLKIKGTIFMPAVTPNQKINKVKKFGGKFVTVVLKGNTYDEAYLESRNYCKKEKTIFVHPFDDPLVIAGQGTVGMEICKQTEGCKFDYIFATIGGGGLISGVSSYLRAVGFNGRIIGVEPEGAAGMYHSLKAGKVITLDKIDTFVDGAAVRTVGEETLAICKKNLDQVVRVPEGKVCTTMIEMYQNDGIVAEPAGALPVSALDHFAEKIKGKKVICIISGGNNDILRYPDIMERSMVYEGLRHYCIVRFAQKPGQLRLFLQNVLGPDDDIIRFEYIKKTNAESGPALVGIEVTKPENFAKLIERMKEAGFTFEVLTSDNILFKYVI